jgi:hypothetical protein
MTIRVDMSNSEKVVEFLRINKGFWQCDRCISVNTGVEPPNQVNQITRPLGTTRDYERRATDCQNCGSTKVCIRRKP